MTRQHLSLQVHQRVVRAFLEMKVVAAADQKNLGSRSFRAALTQSRPRSANDKQPLSATMR